MNDLVITESICTLLLNEVECKDLLGEVMEVILKNHLNIEFEYPSDDAVKVLQRIAEEEEKIDSLWLDEFELLWETYQKKVGKKVAENAFKRARKNPKWLGIEKIIAIVEDWNKTKNWRQDGGKYKPHLASWLNGERWLDELPSITSSAPNILASTQKEREVNNDFF